jgi:serine/threonine protein kinase
MTPEPGSARGDAAGAPSDPFLGRRIHSLVVSKRLTEGGMGIVYLAQHERSPHIKRVIKLLLPEYARVPEIQQRFVREAEAMARLQHDNIVKIEDYGTLPDGQCYLVMEYLHGETLDAYLQRHPRLDPHRACFLLAQICSALQHAHEHGIVHRDLKPSNVFLVRVKSAIRVVLLDFGIAKDTTAGDSLRTDTGMALGTPAYMAVEQFEDASRVTPAADVYALAIIAWQMLTGELPWGMHSAPVLYRKQMSERPVEPPDAVMSRELARVLLAALAVDPVARPQTMRAFAVAFASAIPAIPPDLPSGAEILATVASDLVLEASHHELTLRNLAAQDRLGALLWPHREPELHAPPAEASSGGAPREVPSLAPPTPSYRARPVPAMPAVPDAEPIAPPIPERLALGQPSPGRLGLLAIALALLMGLATFALVRFVKGRGATGASPEAVVQVGSAEPAAPDAGASVARVATDAAVPSAPALDAAPAPIRPASVLDAAPAPPVPAIDAQLAPAPTKPRPSLAPPRVPTPRPAPPAVRVAEPPARAGAPQTGELVVRVLTWAEVYVDGSHKGQAPLRVTVPAGRRSVLLVNDDHRETITITVSPNREAIIQKTW